VASNLTKLLMFRNLELQQGLTLHHNHQVLILLTKAIQEIIWHNTNKSNNKEVPVILLPELAQLNEQRLKLAR